MEYKRKQWDSGLIPRTANSKNGGHIITNDLELDSIKDNFLPPSAKKGTKVKKNWIQGAVNPKHKGYCTPVTKATCTPRRKAFAMTMKKHHGFHKKHQNGGKLYSQAYYDQKADYIKNPFNLERIWNNVKDFSRILKPLGAAALIGASAYPGVALMGYGAPGAVIGGATAASGAGITGILLAPKRNGGYTNKLNTTPNTKPIYKQGGLINYDISNILAQWSK